MHHLIKRNYLSPFLHQPHCGWDNNYNFFPFSEIVWTYPWSGSLTSLLPIVSVACEFCEFLRTHFLQKSFSGCFCSFSVCISNYTNDNCQAEVKHTAFMGFESMKTAIVPRKGVWQIYWFKTTLHRIGWR